MEAIMKRSTPEVMYVTPSDFKLAIIGLKTATSREGYRQESWWVRKRIALVDNEDESNCALIEIVYNFVTKLKDVTITQAGNIGGGYSLIAHFNDFTSVYPDADDDTVLSIIGFRVLSGLES